MNAGKRIWWRRRSLLGVITQTCALPECVTSGAGKLVSPFPAGPAGDDVAHELSMVGSGLGLSEWSGGGGQRSSLNHVCTFAPGLHRDFRKSANKDAGQNGDYSPIRCIYREICTDKNSSLHHLHQERRASPRGQPGSGCL
jgi:hypothetical protein